ncbi:MAG: SDR family NAD(P)-dependent oxidoreductase [bacterium]|nr:SDR family NAD(P)-dependent oxidoreductase [bacterium]
MSKWVAITGAARGLGKELALKFAREKYNLILHARDDETLRRIKHECESLKVEVEIFIGDLRSKEVVETFGDFALLKDPSIIINNAGVPCPGLPLEELKPDDIESLIQVNLIAPIELSRIFYKHFATKKNGTIININSLVGIEPKKLRSVYTAVRYGLRGFTLALSLEAADKGLRIFGVYPSRIKSRPEYQYGFETLEVANRLYDYYRNELGNELVLDGRPK